MNVEVLILELYSMKINLITAACFLVNQFKFLLISLYTFIYLILVITLIFNLFVGV